MKWNQESARIVKPYLSMGWVQFIRCGTVRIRALAVREQHPIIESLGKKGIVA
jgi:hypothetical protein